MKFASGERLQSHWRATWASLGLAAPPGEFERLCARYAHPQRHYHDLRHLEECLDAHRELVHLTVSAGETALALWYHDAVHDPRQGDNESRSAELVAAVLKRCGAGPMRIQRTARLVLATYGHVADGDIDAAVVCDADLWILAASRARFDEYEQDVRREYAWVEEDAYREKRGEVLRRFMDREWIYQTGEYRAQREEQARANLRRSLAALRAG